MSFKQDIFTMNHPQMNIRFTYPILIFFLIILSCSLEEIGANKKQMPNI